MHCHRSSGVSPLTTYVVRERGPYTKRRLIGGQVGVVEIVVFLAVLVVTGRKSALLRAVVVSYVARAVLAFPLPPITTGVILLFVAVDLGRIHQPFSEFAPVVAYTVADVYAARLEQVVAATETRLVLALAGAVVVCALNLRGRGNGLGECVFRTAKFLIVHELVAHTFAVAGSAVYHPVVWLAVVFTAACLARGVGRVSPTAFSLLDSVVHTVAATVSITVFAGSSRLTGFEILLVAGAVYVALGIIPDSPTAALARSVTVLIAVVHLQSLGLFPVAVLAILEF